MKTFIIIYSPLAKLNEVLKDTKLHTAAGCRCPRRCQCPWAAGFRVTAAAVACAPSVPAPLLVPALQLALASLPVPLPVRHRPPCHCCYRCPGALGSRSLLAAAGARAAVGAAGVAGAAACAPSAFSPSRATAGTRVAAGACVTAVAAASAPSPSRDVAGGRVAVCSRTPATARTAFATADCIGAAGCCRRLPAYQALILVSVRTSFNFLTLRIL